jgi:hypothetical protein
MMDSHSGMNIPKQIVVPAGLILMQDLIRFVEQANIFKISKSDVKEAVQKMIVLLLREYQLYDQQVARARSTQQRALQAAAGAAPATPPGILAQSGAQ